MSAVKQSQIQQHRFSPEQKNTVDLNQQQRQAQDLAWTDKDAAESNQLKPEVETAHCAVLGYN